MSFPGKVLEAQVKRFVYPVFQLTTGSGQGLLGTS